MKKRKRKHKIKIIGEERILQLTNDIAEGITSGTLNEWRQVAVYWRNRYDRLWNDSGNLRNKIAPLVMGQRIYLMALKDLAAWLDRQTPESTA